MDNLICHTSNCEHNVKSRCVAGMISLNEKGACLTKIKRDGGILAQTFADIEAAEDFEILDNSTPTIKCNCTNCKFNDKNKCMAEDVIIDDGLSKTKCRTKQKKD